VIARAAYVTRATSIQMQATVVCLIADHLKVEKSLAKSETSVTKKETELEKTSCFFDHNIVN